MSKCFDIFLSYSSQDSNIAKELQAKLQAASLTCFMAEKDIKVSQKWETQIVDALRTADQILILITPRSVSSKWVMLESGAAWVLKKKLVPVLMFCKPDELPEPIKNFQARYIETGSQVDDLVSELLLVKPRGSTRGRNVAPEILTFHDILFELAESARRMIEAKYVPDVIVGSGRGGAICGGILSANFGHKELKLVDCHFKWKDEERITIVDFTSLNRKSIADKKILIVESTRQSGETYRKIFTKVKTLNPHIIKSFALVWRTGAPSKPDHYAFHLDSSRKSLGIWAYCISRTPII